jgi:hypothetical protein
MTDASNSSVQVASVDADLPHEGDRRPRTLRAYTAALASFGVASDVIALADAGGDLRRLATSVRRVGGRDPLSAQATLIY